MSRLADVDLTSSLDKKEYKQRLEAGQARLERLRLTAGGQLTGGDLGPPVCVLVEGWDASGKGGAIQRMASPLDARHLKVVSFAAPTPREKRHHFLWRFWPELPGQGGMTILDRSWYGRVLVERVESFATEAEWRRAYDEINAFERSLADDRMVLVKLWMHVSDEEQLKRFERRARLPLKQWKLTDEDWRNRDKRPQYEAAVEEMLERTDTAWAPWVVIAGDSKKYARVAAIEAVVGAMERGIAAAGLEVPEEEE
jgi:polyphosphate kinase 2 (PPK2 family)